MCAAVVAVAAAASATCNSAVDCMLNGVCEDGACVCDAPWVGSQWCVRCFDFVAWFSLLRFVWGRGFAVQ